MKYKDEYNTLIKAAEGKNRSKGKGFYYENHHIIPESCGGLNNKGNLVLLTPEEHYRCHEILPYIYLDGVNHQSMVYAWNMMNNSIKTDVTIDAEIYAKLRIEHSLLVSERFKGGDGKISCKSLRTGETMRVLADEFNNDTDLVGVNYGINLSEETKELISIATSGENNPNYGNTHNKETRKLMGEASLGMCSVKNITTGEILKVSCEELKNDENYESVSKGVIPPNIVEILICPHCGKKGKGISMKRWHFNNCKLSKV